MSYFDENKTYFIKDLVIEILPYPLQAVKLVQQKQLSSQIFSNTAECAEPEKLIINTLPVVQLWKREGNENVRLSVAYGEKIEELLGMPIRTILDENSYWRKEADELMIGNKCILERENALKQELNKIKNLGFLKRVKFVFTGKI